MTDTQLNLDEPVRLHPLTYLDEGDDVTVGRADIDSYGVFPRDGAELVRRLEQGSSPNQAARWYEEQYGETVDVAEFLEVLGDLDLLVPHGETAAVVEEVRWRRLGSALFSPVAWVVYGVIVAAAVVTMVRDHSLIPRYQHIFFTRSSLTILTLGIVLGQVPWMLLHEAFHALAGRRLGLNSKLSIGRRFYYVVFVTSLDGLVAVPRRKRYLPMLAGMVLDVLAVSSLTLGAAALSSTSGAGAFFYKLFLSMAFGVVIRLAWQFYFFLRTDLFFLASTVLGCNDLQGASREHLVQPGQASVTAPVQRLVHGGVDGTRCSRRSLVLVAHGDRVLVADLHGGNRHGTDRVSDYRDRGAQASRPADVPGRGRSDRVPHSQLQRPGDRRLPRHSQLSPQAGPR